MSCLVLSVWLKEDSDCDKFCSLLLFGKRGAEKEKQLMEYVMGYLLSFMLLTPKGLPKVPFFVDVDFVLPKMIMQHFSSIILISFLSCSFIECSIWRKSDDILMFIDSLRKFLAKGQWKQCTRLLMRFLVWKWHGAKLNWMILSVHLMTYSAFTRKFTFLVPLIILQLSSSTHLGLMLITEPSTLLPKCSLLVPLESKSFSLFYFISRSYLFY